MAKFEEGNNAASKGRKVERMIERALVQEDDKRLRDGVEALLNKVAEGDRWALEFVADRLDGKPKQAVELSSDPENPFQLIVAEATSLRDKIRK